MTTEWTRSSTASGPCSSPTGEKGAFPGLWGHSASYLSVSASDSIASACGQVTTQGIRNETTANCDPRVSTEARTKSNDAKSNNSNHDRYQFGGRNAGTMIVDRHDLSELESKSTPLWWQTKGLSFTASGYGKKIPTTNMVKLPGCKRWRRVYCCIFGNSGTCYVAVANGDWVVIR